MHIPQFACWLLTGIWLSLIKGFDRVVVLLRVGFFFFLTWYSIITGISHYFYIFCRWTCYYEMIIKINEKWMVFLCIIYAWWRCALLIIVLFFCLLFWFRWSYSVQCRNWTRQTCRRDPIRTTLSAIRLYMGYFRHWRPTYCKQSLIIVRTFATDTYTCVVLCFTEVLCNSQGLFWIS